MVEEFKIKVYPYSDRIIYPLKRQLRPSIIVMNTGDKKISLGFRARTKPSYRVSLHPQCEPGRGMYRTYLEPGESTIVETRIPTPPDRLPIEHGEYSLSIEIEVYNINNPAQIKKANLTYRMLITSPEELENTSIRGYVFDKETSKPLPNIEVKLMGGGVYNPSGKTDENGFYEIKCYNDYDYQIEAETLGYGWDHRFVKPPLLGPVRIDLHLEKLKEKVEYQLAKTYKADIGVVIGNMSGNGRYIIFGYRSKGWVWHAVTRETTIYFFDVEGNLLWKRIMGGEVWGVNVSDDGSHVVASHLGAPSDEHGVYKNPEVVLFDGKGDILWKIDAPGQCREATISHNKKYVACQGGCDVCLYELETGKLLWRRFTGGQARNIQFSNDDTSVYVGSGSSYLYKYDIYGKFLWKAFIGSWPENHHSLTISKDDSYILTIGHIGEVTLIDKSGNIRWGLNSGGFGTTSIARDNSYVLVASNGSLGTVKMSVDGKILWRRSPSSGFSGMISDDVKYIVTASSDIKVMDAKGNMLWSYKPVRETPPITNTKAPVIPHAALFLTMTPDNSRIIAAYPHGLIYFFKKS